MWLNLVEGFFSVVEDANDSTKVVVRARVRADLLALRRWVAKLGRVHATPNRDYPFRCVVSKVEFAQGLAAAVAEGLTYKNVKSACCERDPRRSGALMQAWSAFRQLEALNRVENVNSARP